MPETHTVQGRIEVKGTVHGALNTLVYLHSDPADWQFKQFTSQDEMEQFARDNHLAIVHKEHS